MDHLGDGKPWDLNRRINGLFLFPPVNNNHIGSNYGDIAQFYSTKEFFSRAKEEYIFFGNPNIITKLDISSALNFFIESGADVTFIYKEQNDPKGELINCYKIQVDKDGNFLNLGINLATEKIFNQYLGMGFMRKDLFIKLIKDSIEKGNAIFLRDAILYNKDELKINTYQYKGVSQNIRDLKSFYEANIELLDQEISRQIFFEGGFIYTKSKDEPSTLYTETSNVENSLVANGCVIEGYVENSIIFRGVKIGKGAIIKNSIIMQKSEIKENAIIVNSILDKQAFVSEGASIAGSGLAPYVVEKYQKIIKE